MTRSDQTLAWALERLDSLVDERDRPDVEELERRLRDRRLRVLVVGEAKRGKSTLINALLGRGLLPSGVIPLTAVATTVAYGDNEYVEATFSNGDTRLFPLDALDDLVTERGNPKNRKGLVSVTCRVHVPLLSGGIELVDTPGTGSIHEHNTREATDSLRSMDAAIFVVSADPPISAREREWLREVRSQAVRVFCVLNKADYLAADELDETIRFTRDVVSAELGQSVEIFPVSARGALAGGGDPPAGDRRWRDFWNAMYDYLQAGGGPDLVTSIATRAARLTAAVIEQQEAALAALSLSQQQLEQRLSTFGQELHAVEGSRFEAAAIARATFERLLRKTAEDGEAVVRAAAPTLRRDVLEHVAGYEGSLAAMEDAGLRLMEDRIRPVVDQWRQAHTRLLTSEVQALDADLRARVDEHVRRVREAASALFNLELVALPAAEPFVESTRFSYAFGPDIGQTEAIAATIRTHLPGQLGRHRVSQYLSDRSVELLDRQVGRARADFTGRLRETRRQMERGVQARFDAGAGRIAEAVQRTAGQRRDASANVQQLHAAARQRVDQAEQLANQLRPFVDNATPDQVP